MSGISGYSLPFIKTMAKIHVIGSSSKGNGYVIETKTERLILECGCRWNDVLKACKFHIRTISGCLVTHQHGDHAKYLKEYACKGFTILAPGETFKNAKVFTLHCKVAKIGKGYKLGGFKVLVLQAFHDKDVPTYAYVIDHEEFGRIVFATDTYSFPYNVPGVSLWMIEANYSDEIVDDRVAKGLLPISQRDRLMITHMEVGNAIKALKRNFNTRSRMPMTYDCILLHLSDGNSNAKEFAERVSAESGMNAIVADSGMVIDLEITH